MKLKIKKLSDRAIVPKLATDGAACFDLHAIDVPIDVFDAFPPALHPAAPIVFRTGLAFEIPSGHAMLIFSRSGHGFKNDTPLANCVGVIDSDYRGEVMVKLTRDPSLDGAKLTVDDGDRIAQAMIVELPYVSIEVVDELSTTARGAGGFGSTGN